MPDKAFDESTLRVFLQRLNASEIIEIFIIPMVNTVARMAVKPEKFPEKFHELTMDIVVQIRTYLVFHDRENLRDYPEATQKKVFGQLLTITTGKLEGDTFEKTFKDWNDSGKTFNQWRNS